MFRLPKGGFGGQACACRTWHALPHITAPFHDCWLINELSMPAALQVLMCSLDDSCVVDILGSPRDAPGLGLPAPRRPPRRPAATRTDFDALVKRMDPFGFAYGMDKSFMRDGVWYQMLPKHLHNAGLSEEDAAAVRDAVVRQVTPPPLPFCSSPPLCPRDVPPFPPPLHLCLSHIILPGIHAPDQGAPLAPVTILAYRSSGNACDTPEQTTINRVLYL